MPAGITADASGALPKLGRAPGFTDNERWFNTPGDRPQTLAALRGRGAVLVDFWTYTCINCLRTLPYLEAWDRKYRAAGLTIVGVHTPEFAFEHDAGNVANAIKRLGIRYPVAQDNAMGTWNAYGNQYWPADYLIDRTGQVRYAGIGEGDYDKTEAAIRSVLAEAGHDALGAGARPKDVVVPSRATSPETYLGTARAQGWLAGQPKSGRHEYPGVEGDLALNAFAYGGEWTIGGQAATSGAGATIDAEVRAKNVYLVLGSRGAAPGRAGPARRAPGERAPGGARTCTAAASRSPASACMRSSRCRAISATASHCASPPDLGLRVHVRLSAAPATIRAWRARMTSGRSRWRCRRPLSAPPTGRPASG